MEEGKEDREGGRTQGALNTLPAGQAVTRSMSGAEAGSLPV